MKKLSKRDRRVLVFGGGFAVLVILIVYVMLPFYDSVSQVEQDLAQKERMLAQSVKAIRGQDDYLRALSEVDGELQGYRVLLLDAVNASIAQNQLENMVRSLAEQNGVTISRSTPLQATKVGERYSKITVQINLQSGMVELANFMEAISMHQKFLLVDDFFMNVFRVRNKMRLQPRMNVSGFIRLSES
ncbi:MAG: type II secretion system protein M [Acidobacteriota bacterium]|nr:MAG: type II secretion system protein M [Acidobacteriota bacterium]